MRIFKFVVSLSLTKTYACFSQKGSAQGKKQRSFPGVLPSVKIVSSVDYEYIVANFI